VGFAARVRALLFLAGSAPCFPESRLRGWNGGGRRNTKKGAREWQQNEARGGARSQVDGVHGAEYTRRVMYCRSLIFQRNWDSARKYVRHSAR